jgi:hypothetical protein
MRGIRRSKKSNRARARVIIAGIPKGPFAMISSIKLLKHISKGLNLKTVVKLQTNSSNGISLLVEGSFLTTFNK